MFRAPTYLLVRADCGGTVVVQVVAPVPVAASEQASTGAHDG